MGMPAVLTATGTTTSAIWMPDWMQVPFVVGIACVSNTAGFQIEATFDDLDVKLATSLSTNAFTAGNATWFTVISLAAVNVTALLQTPVRGLRINSFTSSAGSTVVATFIQATFPR